MPRLYNLFTKYGTDKGVNGYAGIYECLFTGISPARLLEVGVGSMDPARNWNMMRYALEGYRPGGSLRSWRDYFKPAAIYGIDPAPDAQLENETNITTFLCDSTDRTAVRQAIGNIAPFDIIIDDGAHDAVDQIRTAANLFPYVLKTGFYIIEDVMPGNAEILAAGIQHILDDAPWFMLGPKLNMMVIRKV